MPRKPAIASQPIEGELVPAGQADSAGRPSEYGQAIADRIIDRLNEGKSFNWFESDEATGYPAKSTIRRWRALNDEFDARCARACELQAEADYDRMEEIEAQVINGKIEAKAANAVLSNMRWRMEKRKARVFGQRIDHKHSGKVGLEALVAGEPEPVEQ